MIFEGSTVKSLVVITINVALLIWFADRSRARPNRIAQVLWPIALGSCFFIPIFLGRKPSPFAQVIASIGLASAIILILLKLWLWIQARSEREACQNLTD